MSIATYKTTTIKKLVADTKFELRLDGTTAEDIYITRYVKLCAQAMMTALDYVEKTFTLPIENYIAVLPCEFVKFDRPNPIVFTTNGQVDYSGYYSYFNVTYNGSAFLTCSPYNTGDCLWGIPRVQVQNGRLYFSNNIGATECTISCLCVRMNEEGEIEIPELNGRTIVCGAAFMYKNSIGQPDPINAGFWARGVQDRRGDANLPDSLEQQECERIWNSMLL